MAHMASPKVKRLKTTVAMSKFCMFCTRAGMHEMGYVESSSGSIQLDDEGSDEDPAVEASLDLEMEDGNEDDRAGSDAEETDEEESDQGRENRVSGRRRPQTLSDIKGSVDNCLLCEKVWSAFEKWATEKYVSLDHIDLSTSGVTIWPTELSEKWRLYEEDASYGTYTGGTLSILRVRIRVQDPDDSEEWLEPELKFQKCEEHIARVVDIFDTADNADVDDPLSWPDTEPYIGRRRPLMADLRLFRKWKSFCDATHDGNCQPGRIPLGSCSLRFIRLINVETYSIVEVEDIEKVSWVAISYVWGKKRFRTLTDATLGELKKEGALKASWTPETIADAIEVTRGVGEKYLWTDSLCIIQDSVTDKMHFVPRMDIIYGRATLTIVNAAGDNAFSGLPGVRAGTRFQQEEPFLIGGDQDTDNEPTWLVQTHEPIRTSRELVEDSCWFTRGWTYQEAMLSQRWLIFTPEQVYWECRQVTWREDACWELPQWREKKQTVIYDPAFDSHLLQDLWNPSSAKSFDMTYQTLVGNYLKRDLTNESDGLDAIGGVLRAVTEVTGFEFLWGLPKEFFAVTIAWPCCLQRPHRRTGRCRIEVGGGDENGVVKTVQACFPSWSWVGWVGEIWAEPSDFVGPTAGLEFYHTVSSDTGEDNLILKHITHEEKPSQAAYEPSRWKSPNWRGDTRAMVSLKDIPAALLVPETQFSLLVLWTSVAELSFEKDTSVPEDRDWEDIYGLWVGQDTKMDVIWDQYPEFIKDWKGKKAEDRLRRRAECIVIGRDSLDRGREKGRLSVLLVERHSHGGISRIGHVWFWEHEWDQLTNRRWEMVCLV
ncbi:heterokaryon incompatibility protein-domain-containing protein [Fusarium solani]|uniref:Heterokaryon incompatibility protein-domain-containing protein n=1 Tax=Fusarium solani TaxID=169388 RepID=A0A9P9HLR6_FUSSL|nr:heterokaryon incompatibility protein-domain-containing protein [Fusarium solani]KAH7259885.1 heterokaryon incompatibility protein-domain-containing protein [Fusarium solani]